MLKHGDTAFSTSWTRHCRYIRLRSLSILQLEAEGLITIQKLIQILLQAWLSLRLCNSSSSAVTAPVDDVEDLNRPSHQSYRKPTCSFNSKRHPHPTWIDLAKACLIELTDIRRASGGHQADINQKIRTAVLISRTCSLNSRPSPRRKSLIPKYMSG